MKRVARILPWLAAAGGLALLVPSGLAAFVGSRLAAHPGFGSPMRLDTTPVKLKMGKRFYAIPANHFDSPIQVEGREGEFTVTDGVFLVGLYPDFEGRTMANREAFDEGGWNRATYILGQTSSPLPLDQQIAVDLRLALERAPPTGPWREEGGERIAELRRVAPGPDSEWRDIFVDADGKRFTLCMRSEWLPVWNR